jgi:hypothetical protein
MIIYLLLLFGLYFILTKIPLNYQAFLIAFLVVAFLYKPTSSHTEDIKEDRFQEVYIPKKKTEPVDLIDSKIDKITDAQIREIVIDSKIVGSFNLVEFIELIDYIIMFQKITEGKYYKCKYFVDTFMETKNKILNTYNSFIHSMPPPMDSKVYQRFYANMNKLEGILNEQLARYSYKCQELSFQNINTDSYLSQDLILNEKPANTFIEKDYQYFL